MLTTEFAEAQDDAVVTVGDTTPTAFKAVLRYLYTDTLVCDEESVVDIMCKAREYDLRHLLKLCHDYCAEKLAPPNAIPWLVQAEVRQLNDLRALAMGFVKRNFRRIRMVAKDTLVLLSECPEVMVEVMEDI